MSLTKIGSIGINTGIQFAGVTTVSTLHVGSGVTLSSDGDVFATGISTFSEDIKVGSGVTISPDGDGFYTGVVTATTFSGALAASSLTGALPAISGANLTNLDASDLASGTVPTARLGSGTASSSTFLRGDSTFQTVNTDLVSDTSPQLGGNLDLNGNSILLDDDEKIFIGTSNDGSLFNSGSFLFLKNHNGAVAIQGTNYVSLQKYDNSDIGLQYVVDGAVKIYYDNSIRIETSSDGGIVKNNSGGGATKLNIVGPEGHDGILNLIADDGDDDADHYRLLSSTDGSFYLQNYTSGSWEFNLKATGNGAVELYYDDSKRIETHTQGAAIASGAMTMPAMNSFSSQILVGNSGFIGNYHDGTTNQQLIVGTNQYFDSAYKTRTNATAAHIQFYERTFRFNTAAAPGSAGGTLTQEQALRIDTDGIKFGTDTAAANALDDYEEGSWPVSYTHLTLPTKRIV